MNKQFQAMIHKFEVELGKAARQHRELVQQQDELEDNTRHTIAECLGVATGSCW